MDRQAQERNETRFRLGKAIARLRRPRPVEPTDSERAIYRDAFAAGFIAQQRTGETAGIPAQAVSPSTGS